MKYITLLSLIPSLLFGASQDFSKGIDFTGRSNVTQSALNQLVDSATPATNRGLVIVTNNSPSVANDPKLVRYVWMDSSVNPPVLKTYNTNSGLWVSATVGAGTITTAMLADGAVTTIKIANSAVDNSKLADDSVTSAKIVDRTITGTDIGLNTIQSSNLAPNAVGSGALAAGVVWNTNLNPYIIYQTNLAIGFLIWNTNLGPSSVHNTNIQANAIQSTNIVAGGVSNVNIANGAIMTNNLATNIVTLLPRVFATLDSAGTILRGIGFSSAVRTSAGDFTLTFADAPGFTNYCVQAMTMDFGGSAGDIGVSVSTNTTTTVSVNCWVRGTGADVDPDLLYITVQY